VSTFHSYLKEIGMKKEKKVEQPKTTEQTEGARQLELAEEKAKYVAEIQDMNKQLQEIENEIAKRAALFNQRELLLLAIAERKGIVAYLNQKLGG
jgi:hypothetical protein